MEKTPLGDLGFFTDRSDTYVAIALGMEQRGSGIQYLLSCVRLSIHSARLLDRSVYINTGFFIVVSDEQDLTERVMEITSGLGANVLFDPVGGPLLEILASAAARQAIIVEYGALSTSPTTFPLFTALAKGLTIRGYTLFELTQDDESLARA